MITISFYLIHTSAIDYSTPQSETHRYYCFTAKYLILRWYPSGTVKVVQPLKLCCVCVAVPSARILGGPDLHVDIGSTINLTCLIQFSPEPPAYIFWYHEDEVSGRKVITDSLLLLLLTRAPRVCARVADTGGTRCTRVSAGFCTNESTLSLSNFTLTTRCLFD